MKHTDNHKAAYADSTLLVEQPSSCDHKCAGTCDSMTTPTPPIRRRYCVKKALGIIDAVRKEKLRDNLTTHISTLM